MRYLVPAISWTIAVLLGLHLGGTQTYRRTTDAGILDRLLGDTREILARRMLRKADQYFHGGMDVANCTHGLAEHAQPAPQRQVAHAGTHDGDDDHDRHEKAAGKNGKHRIADGYQTVAPAAANHARSRADDDRHRHDHHAHAGDRPTDWWSVINRHVHPHDHRHMHGRENEKEILPWIWAATRSDPHNILAFDIGAYWLNSRLGKPKEAVDLLRLGIQKNPDSYYLRFRLGRVLYHGQKDLAGAEKALKDAYETYRKAADRASSTTGDPAGIPDTHPWQMLFYLGIVSEKQGNIEAALDYYQRASEFPSSPPTMNRHIRRTTRLLGDMPNRQKTDSSTRTESR